MISKAASQAALELCSSIISGYVRLHAQAKVQGISMVIVTLIFPILVTSPMNGYQAMSCGLRLWSSL